MLKNILKLEGAQELSKKEQKSIKGGLVCVSGHCPTGSYCCDDGTVEGLCRRLDQTCNW